MAIVPTLADCGNIEWTGVWWINPPFANFIIIYITIPKARPLQVHLLELYCALKQAIKEENQLNTQVVQL